MLDSNPLFITTKCHLCLKNIAFIFKNFLKDESFIATLKTEETKLSEIFHNTIEEQLNKNKTDTIQKLRIQYLFNNLFNDIPIFKLNDIK